MWKGQDNCVENVIGNYINKDNKVSEEGVGHFHSDSFLPVNFLFHQHESFYPFTPPKQRLQILLSMKEYL